MYISSYVVIGRGHVDKSSNDFLFRFVNRLRIELQLSICRLINWQSRDSESNTISEHAILKAKLLAISSDRHQLQLIKRHHFKLEIFKSI